MRVLLDASCMFDLMDRPGMSPDSDHRFQTARGTDCCVSAVSNWELRLRNIARHRSGGRRSRFSPEDVVGALEDQDVTFPPIAVRHAAGELDRLPDHKDPFDERLLVQAQEEGLRLPAVDRPLVGHPLAIAVQKFEGRQLWKSLTWLKPVGGNRATSGHPDRNGCRPAFRWVPCSE